jgi:hypothetical protein
MQSLFFPAILDDLFKFWNFVNEDNHVYFAGLFLCFEDQVLKSKKVLIYS